MEQVSIIPSHSLSDLTLVYWHLLRPYRDYLPQQWGPACYGAVRSSSFQENYRNGRRAWRWDFWRDWSQNADTHVGMFTSRKFSSWELYKKTWRSCADVSTLKRIKSLPQILQEKLWMAIEDDLLADGDAESGFEEQYVNRIGKEDISIWKQNCDRKRSWKRCSRDYSAKQQV